MIAGKEEIERQKVFGRDHFVYEENSYFIDVNDDSERMWFQNRIGVPNYKWFRKVRATSTGFSTIRSVLCLPRTGMEKRF